MQTPPRNQTINQIPQKTIFLIFAKIGLLQYNTTNKGSRPEIQDDPGERGRGKEESRQSSTPPTRDSAPCPRRSSAEILPQRDGYVRKRRHRCQEEERQPKPDQGIVLLGASRKNTGKRGNGNG